MKSVRRIVCIMLSLLLAAAIAGCGNGDDGYDYTPNATVPGQQESASLALPGSDVLPDALVGTWYPEGIYQYAVASDISDEQAVEYERAHCLAISYTAFDRYMDDISAAVYKVNEKASFDDMLAQGIQVDPLVEKYGEYAQITSAAVYDADGSYCATVFLVGGEELISYGAGMNVFSYRRMDAEG